VSGWLRGWREAWRVDPSEGRWTIFGLLALGAAAWQVGQAILSP
jgi:hypothetical protein